MPTPGAATPISGPKHVKLGEKNRPETWPGVTVVASQVDGVDVGERFYGYWPPATVLRVQPDKISAHGFRDATRHRRALPPVYNQYFRCTQDPLYTPETEAFQALYRPLFMTGFSLADFIADREAFGARRVLFSSASSKTAYGTAFCMDEAVETVHKTVGYDEAHRDQEVAGLLIGAQVAEARENGNAKAAGG